MDWIVLVWRPEAGEAGFAPHSQNPFDGIEVLSMHDTEDEATDEAVAMREQHPNWRLHVDCV